MPADPVRAAVDCGTNSTRVLVIDGHGRHLAREMTITRLGQGVDETGRLDPGALERTIDTLRGYRDIWERHGATTVRVAATSAVRDAANRDEFFAAVRRLAGVDAEVLTGVDEARVTFHGVTSALDVERPAVVLDVGGGSTELVVGDRDDGVAGAVSSQLGSVRLTERLLRSDPPTPEQIADARAEIRSQLDSAAQSLGEQGQEPSAATSLVGVAGTVTTLAALYLELDRYEPDRIHGTWIPSDAVGSLTGLLGGMKSSKRAELGPMSAGREDVIFGGALIVEAVVNRFGFPGLYASESDILDGLALGA